MTLNTDFIKLAPLALAATLPLQSLADNLPKYDCSKKVIYGQSYGLWKDKKAFKNGKVVFVLKKDEFLVGNRKLKYQQKGDHWTLDGKPILKSKPVTERLQKTVANEPSAQQPTYLSDKVTAHALANNAILVVNDKHEDQRLLIWREGTKKKNIVTQFTVVDRNGNFIQDPRTYKQIRTQQLLNPEVSTASYDEYTGNFRASEVKFGKSTPNSKCLTLAMINHEAQPDADSKSSLKKWSYLKDSRSVNSATNEVWTDEPPTTENQ